MVWSELGRVAGIGVPLAICPMPTLAFSDKSKLRRGGSFEVAGLFEPHPHPRLGLGERRQVELRISPEGAIWGSRVILSSWPGAQGWRGSCGWEGF